MSDNLSFVEEVVRLDVKGFGEPGPSGADAKQVFIRNGDLASGASDDDFFDEVRRPAVEAGNVAETQGNVAAEQGNVAETQGNVAAEQGDDAAAKGNTAAAAAATALDAAAAANDAAAGVAADLTGAIAAEAAARDEAIAEAVSDLLGVGGEEGQTIAAAFDALDAEATARAEADTTEAAARATADTNETTTRIAGDAAEATARAAADTTEATARATADTNEAAARIAGDAAEATARAAADTTETTARIAGDAAEATARATADTNEATARIAADAAEATARTAAITQAVSDLRAGVVAAGDTFAKLYALYTDALELLAVSNEIVRSEAAPTLRDELSEGPARGDSYGAIAVRPQRANGEFVDPDDQQLAGPAWNSTNFTSASTGTTGILTEGGLLGGFVVGVAGAAGAKFELWDSLSDLTGTKIGTYDATVVGRIAIERILNVGLALVKSGSPNFGDITVLHRL